MFALSFVVSNILINEKTYRINSLACAVSGLVADARTLIERARTEATHHWFVYNEKMTVEDVTKAVSNLALAFGDDDMESGAMVSAGYFLSA